MPRESRKALQQRALVIRERLDAAYPDATCSLHWKSPLELLVATILSAQTTDETVNKVTPGLFSKYPAVSAFAAADPAQLEQDIASIGLFRNKTKSIIGAAQALLDRFGGEVPPRMGDLLTLPGVARKTASVVLGNAFEIAEGIVVDTHVSRLAIRMALSPPQTTKAISTDKIEKDLMALIPREHWISFGHCMVWHGRRICQARKPLCPECTLADICPKAGV